MRYFTKELIANHPEFHGRWFESMAASWDNFLVHEENLWGIEQHSVGALGLRLMANSTARNLLGNQAAILPRDAWLAFDATARQIMRTDLGRPYMADLMALARPVDIGKLAHVSSVSSDISDDVTMDMTGQTPVPVDNVTWAYRGTPVPLFQKGFGRKWRQWHAMTSENFDPLIDDQEAAAAKVAQRNAQYFLDGNAQIKIENYVGYGIRTNPLSKSINLGSAAGGWNIDLTSAATTSDAIENFINNGLGALLDDNLVDRPLNLYVSPEIMRNLDRPYSGALGFKYGTIRDALLANRRIAKIEQTYELNGNEFFGFVPDSRFIRPIVGMATSTFAMPRLYPQADYHFMVQNAMGLEIRADFAGKSGVVYSVDVD